MFSFQMNLNYRVERPAPFAGDGYDAEDERDPHRQHREISPLERSGAASMVI